MTDKSREAIIAAGQADPLPTIGELLASENNGHVIPEIPSYMRCSQDLGLHACNLPNGHDGEHEYLQCCLTCGCSPCICNGS